ncbi:MULTISPECIES: ABC transporter transmembrane domain-containing protein [Inquilinus]|uniref:ABC-type multidrug transport system fused ATPase/permease subunit n=1 Tax=Inquilinus ginsengisoli TaxID=363840 RepID=A0ABU1JKV3_9PROT|nr:ABC transporter transmembrane domain-containing protein [Inquilinus ginsengisoli]MDR6288180.1 ABC-type multidrug transport system fused ATPase/permease subunit [Inquilinus ginsengisoli]
MGFTTPTLAGGSTVDLPDTLLGFILRASRWHQLALAVLSTGVFLLTIAPIELQRRIVDDTLYEHDFRPVLLLALAYGGVAILEGLVKLLTNIYRGWVGESAVRLLREKVRLGLHDLPAARHDSMADGIGLSMMVAESDDIGGFVGNSLSEPVLQGGILLSAFAYMLYIQPFMALASFAVFVPQLVLVPMIQGRINRRVSRRITMLRQVSIAVTSSPVSAGSEEQTRRFDSIFTLNVGVFVLKFSMNFLMNIFYHLGVTCAFGLGGWYVVHGEAGIGTVVAIISGLSKINDPWGDLVTWYRDLTVTQVKYRLIADALRAIPAA